MSREETLDNATYPTAGDNIHISKTNMTCFKVWPITLGMVEAYPATIGKYSSPLL